MSDLNSAAMKVTCEGGKITEGFLEVEGRIWPRKEEENSTWVQTVSFKQQWQFQ